MAEIWTIPQRSATKNDRVKRLISIVKESLSAFPISVDERAKHFEIKGLPHPVDVYFYDNAISIYNVTMRSAAKLIADRYKSELGEDFKVLVVVPDVSYDSRAPDFH